MNNFESKNVTKATLGRLPLYLQYLKRSDQSVTSVSATTIAKALGLGEVQVRKDLNSVSGIGKPRVGYRKQQLMDILERYLSRDHRNLAVVVGAGKLGRALLDYDGFSEYGLEIVAAFDIDPGRLGSSLSGKPILPMQELQPFCRGNNIRLGIITVPQSSAQQVSDTMVASGIRAIWDFAPGSISVPEGIHVQHENLALSLAHLSTTISNL